MDYVDELVELADDIFHPFIGLIPWKYREPVSAYLHSLSVGILSYEICNLISNSENECLISGLAGLLHDVPSKLPPAISNELFKHIKEKREYGEKTAEIVKTMAIRNIAENPRAFENTYPVVAVSVHLADRIASASSFLEVERKIWETRSELASTSLAKYINEIGYQVYSVSLPQLFLREAIYELVEKSIRSKVRDAVIISAGYGIIALHRVNEKLDTPITIDYNDIRHKIDYTLESIQSFIANKKVRDAMRSSLNYYAVDSQVKPKLHRSITGFLMNIELSNVDFTSEEIGRCMFCNMPVPEEQDPRLYIYFRNLGKSEAWNKKYPVVDNLNRFMQSNKWREFRIYSCTPCNLDALLELKKLGKPTRGSRMGIEFNILKAIPVRLFRVLRKRISYAFSSDVRYSDLILDKLYKNREPYNVKEILKQTEEAGEDVLAATVDDYTSNKIIVVNLPMGEEGGVYGLIAEMAWRIGLAILLTGIYPAKLTTSPERETLTRIFEPTMQIYDYPVIRLGEDPSYEYRALRVPLTIHFLLLGGYSEAEPGKWDSVVFIHKAKLPPELTYEALGDNKYGIKVLRHYTSTLLQGTPPPTAWDIRG